MPTDPWAQRRRSGGSHVKGWLATLVIESLIIVGLILMALVLAAVFLAIV